MTARTPRWSCRCAFEPWHLRSETKVAARRAYATFSPVLLPYVLLAAVAVSADKPKLVVLDLAPGAGVDASVTGPLTEALTAEVARRGFFEVISQRDMSTLMGVERQKQLMGCSEESTSCLSELSGALGAQVVLSGTVAKLGDAFQMTLSTLDTHKAQPLARSTRIAANLGTLQQGLAYASAEATATPLPPPPSRLLPYSLLGAGSAAVIFGGVWGLVAISDESRLKGEIESVGERPGVLGFQDSYQKRADTIGTHKIISLAAMGAGAALIAAGIVLMPSDPGAPSSSVALVPTASGAALVGVFP